MSGVETGSSEQPRRARRLLAIVTDDPLGPESLREIGSNGGGRGAPAELRLIVPAVEANAFRHTLGDVDEPKRDAEARLGRLLEELRAAGVEAIGEVGDADPIQAAKDALLAGPEADEIVIFEHERSQARWFEDGLLERAEAELDPPLRMVVLHDDRDGRPHVVGVEASGRGTHDPAEEHEIGSAYLMSFSRADFAGMVAGLFGTIVAAILAGAVAVDNGEVSGRAAAAILIAIGISLINMAHVVGLTLMDSVRYHGGFARLFRYLSLTGTPLAVIVILVLLLV